MKEQFRDSKKGISLLEKTQIVLKRVEIDYEELLSYIEFDDRVDFVTLLDEDSEDWDITEGMFRYLSQQILSGLESEREEDDKMFDSSLYDLIDSLKISADKSRNQFLKI